jgi:hypothetical protein
MGAARLLTIRKEQIKVFEDQRNCDFKRRLFERLKRLRVDAHLNLSDEELERQMELGVASGRRFFSSENDLTRYLELVLTRMGGWTGADLPKHVLDLLSSFAIQPANRLDNLEYWLVKTKKPNA